MNLMMSLGIFLMPLCSVSKAAANDTILSGPVAKIIKGSNVSFPAYKPRRVYRKITS